MEMKQVLQRQPGPEVAEQLQIYQQSLKEKTKQMKVWSSQEGVQFSHPRNLCGICVAECYFGFPSSIQSMASELNMYESQVAEYKMDIDRLQRELQEVKKKYYLQKKKEHHQK